MCIIFILINWLVGIIEEEEIEKAAKIALDSEKKRNNEELSHHILKLILPSIYPTVKVCLLKTIFKLTIMHRAPLKWIKIKYLKNITYFLLVFMNFLENTFYRSNLKNITY